MHIPENYQDYRRFLAPSKLAPLPFDSVGSSQSHNILKSDRGRWTSLQKRPENPDRECLDLVERSAPASLYSLLPSPLTTVTEQEAEDTISCYEAAIWQGYPINALITVSWEKAGIKGDTFRAHQEVIQAFYQFMHRNGIPAIYIWVRENGKRYGEHTHLAFHIPKYLRSKVRTVVCKAIKRVGGAPRKVGVQGIVKLSRDHFVPQREVETTYPLIEYLLKGVDEETAEKFGLVSNLGKAGQVKDKRIGQSKAARRMALDDPARREETAVAFLAFAGVNLSESAPADSKIAHRGKVDSGKERAYAGISIVEGLGAMTGEPISQRKAASFLNALGPEFSARGGKWTPKSYRKAKTNYTHVRSADIRNTFEAGAQTVAIARKFNDILGTL